MLEPGTRAPDFESDSTTGRFRLSDALEAGPLVLFFYFKADTPGWTNEVLEFEAWFDRFDELGVRVAGCSTDSLEAQKAFADKIGSLRFPLIADPDAEVSTAFGVYKEDWKVAGRATAVIGEDATILQTYPAAPLDGKGHAEAVYGGLKDLLRDGA